MDETPLSAAGRADPWLRLRHCAGCPGSVVLKLIKQLGSAEAVLGATDQVLRSVLETGAVSGKSLNTHDKQALQTDTAWLVKSNRHHVVSWQDDLYPPLLRELPDAPLLLYVSGDPRLLASTQLAIVGSRNPTPAGCELAFRFASNLASSGFTITSGMAIGIDGSAHQGALSSTGHTIAVTATGLDRIYPQRHQRLARQIAARGAIVSEYPITTPPRKHAFPRRNRIISGLCVGTLVVEAAQRSGSLITARLAGEQGREVYAVPGSVLSPLSRGCHALIRDGARLVETELDIFAELQHLQLPLHEFSRPESGLDENPLLLSSMGHDPVTIDALVKRSGLTADTVCSMLLRLELEGVVKAMAGGHYIRIGG